MTKSAPGCMSLEFIMSLQLDVTTIKRQIFFCGLVVCHLKERLHEWKIPHAKAVQPAQLKFNTFLAVIAQTS